MDNVYYLTPGGSYGKVLRQLNDCLEVQAKTKNKKDLKRQKKWEKSVRARLRLIVARDYGWIEKDPVIVHY